MLGSWPPGAWRDVARSWKRTTIADPDAQAAVDLIKRAFGPGTVEVDRVYVGDITYLRTWEGWAYLATVIDLASRRVVGWAIADHMEASLACDALKMAIAARRPGPGFIMHTDRGAQYTSKDFRALLEAHHGVQSLSRKGQRGDDAVGESWFATLKEELIHGQSWATTAQVRRAVIEFIEIFYNRQRSTVTALWATSHPSSTKGRSTNTPAGRRHNKPVRQTGAAPW